MVKINLFEAENIKRIKAVAFSPTANGLTIIGGDNEQGKTTTLDTIAWLLGGDRYKPSSPEREGSTLPPALKLTLDNGLVVERKGKNGSLKVTDPEGRKGGQQLLNSFVESLALDLPKFMESSNREKAETMLRIVGIGDQLAAIERKETELYNERLAIGRIADQKSKFAKEQPHYPDAPKELISMSELIQRQQDILAKNGENDRKRRNLAYLEQQEIQAEELVARKRKELEEAQEKLAAVSADVLTARKSAHDLHDESTEELERSISDIETINAKVRANLDKEKAEDEAKAYSEQYTALDNELSGIRTQKLDLLNGAELPLPGLSVADGELTYEGKKWDCMSGSARLKVSVAIVRKLNPECGFVLMDKLEQMDVRTLTEFGEWLENENLQVIATRVSTGEECSIIIEDGEVVKSNLPETGIPVTEDKPAVKTWKAGEF